MVVAAAEITSLSDKFNRLKWSNCRIIFEIIWLFVVYLNDFVYPQSRSFLIHPHQILSRYVFDCINPSEFLVNGEQPRRLWGRFLANGGNCVGFEGRPRRLPAKWREIASASLADVITAFPSAALDETPAFCDFILFCASARNAEMVWSATGGQRYGRPNLYYDGGLLINQPRPAGR